MAESISRTRQVKSLLVIALISLLVGIGIGVTSSVFLRSEGAVSKEQQEGPIYKERVEKDPATTQPPVPATSIQPGSLDEFSDPSKFESLLERSLALNEFLAPADTDRLLTYLEHSKEIKGRNRREFMENAIVMRLALIDPEVALSAIDGYPRFRKQRLVSLVFREWSLANLNETIEHAEILDEEIKESAVAGILYTNEHLSDRRLRELARRIGHEDAAIDFIAQSKIDAFRDDPESAWNAFLAEYKPDLNNLTNGQGAILGQLATSWLEKDGIDVLSQIENSLDDRKVYRSLVPILASLLSESSPQLALAVAIRSSDHASRYWATNVTENWAKRDPRATLNAVLEIESPSLREKLLDHALIGWASSDPHGLLREIASLPQEIRARSLEKALISLAQTEPQAVIGYLDEISTRKSMNAVAEAIAVNWARQDLEASLTWIRSDSHTAKIRSDLFKSVFRELANEDPSQAFNSALAQPLDESNVGLEAEVVSWVSYRDPDLAVSMLEDIERNDETKAEAYNNVIRTLTMIDESKIAIEVALELAETGRFMVGYQSIFSMIATRDPELLFNTFSELPAGELKNHIADELKTSFNVEEYLSEAQIEQLNESVPESRSLPNMSDRLREAFEKVNEIIKEEAE